MASTLETCANTAGRPGSPSAGDTLYQIDTKQIITWDGSAWRLYESDGTAVNDADITDLNPHLWLDPMHSAPFFTDSGKGTAVTADGNRVGCFADRSGNGFDFVQATAANKPILALNQGTANRKGLVFSYDDLSFTGTSDSEIDSDELTCFWVWRLDTESQDYVIEGTVNGNEPRMRVSSASTTQSKYDWRNFGDSQGGTEGPVVTSSALDKEKFQATHIYCLKTNPTANRTYNYYNGGADIAGSTAAPGATGKFLNDGYALKVLYAHNNSAPNWLFEFLVFDASLSDANVNKVNSYLGNKYGITVADVS